MLFIVSALCAAAYGGYYCYRDPHWIGGLVKTASTAILALAAFASLQFGLALALALSSAGDFALSRKGERWFIGGLVSFALAHAVYIVLLAGAGMPPVLIMFVLAGLALSSLWWLLPFTGALRIPVAIYVVLITGMGVAAWGHDNWLLRLGASLFIASDVILAWHLFRAKTPFVPRQITLWAFYYTGQVALMAGLN
ncbi:lysoplasmalogenase family protein [Litoreibacter halocynthiae]|uniref:lysoplasmalogenase family protein n=1 Tax=Litoreibacter halocynthiae TaxID=1242689 RepID=UPI0010639283|nr:lysoplasmalogenase family protein [Litoreibacter halocynthiae]